MTSSVGATRSALVAYVLSVFAEALGVASSELDDVDPAEPLLLSSVQNMSVVARLDEVFGDIPLTLIFDHPSPLAVVGFLTAQRQSDVARMFRG